MREDPIHVYMLPFVHMAEGSAVFGMQGNDASLDFLKSVFEEIFELFPSKYVHIGGDEVGSSTWAQCALLDSSSTENDACPLSGSQQ